MSLTTKQIDELRAYAKDRKGELAKLITDAADTIEMLSIKQQEPKWKRLMMYLADLQLTYSPNWGANGCGDQKLYEFVTGLIDELQGWEEGEK